MQHTIGTYDTIEAKQATLDQVISILTNLGAKNIFVKRLASNDNSKNQPYFGAHLTDLPFIPSGNIEPSDSTSKKATDPKRQIKYQASIKLTWVDIGGNLYSAPNAKLIYYPQYPEVRFSGFLRGSKDNASKWMSPEKNGRSLGRWLVTSK